MLPPGEANDVAVNMVLSPAVVAADVLFRRAGAGWIGRGRLSGGIGEDRRCRVWATGGEAMSGVRSHEGKVCGVTVGLVSHEVGVPSKRDERRFVRGFGVLNDGVGENEKAETCESCLGWAAGSARSS
jgi:hypothetical protein